MEVVQTEARDSTLEQDLPCSCDSNRNQMRRRRFKPCVCEVLIVIGSVLVLIFTISRQSQEVLRHPRNLRADVEKVQPDNFDVFECIQIRSLDYLHAMFKRFEVDANAFLDARDDGAQIERIYDARVRKGRRDEYGGQGHEGGLDRYIAEVLLPWRQRGRFFEMGAYDGWQSNSRYFEFARNWTGVMVEANTAMFMVAKRNRPNTPIFNVAVSATEGFLTNAVGWGATTVTTCSSEKASQSDAEQHKTDMELQTTALGVPCKPMNVVLAEQGLFDWASLDCEGCERAGILTWDFAQNPAGIISMESLDEDMSNRLLENGYVYLGKVTDHAWVQPSYIYKVNANRWLEFCKDDPHVHGSALGKVSETDADKALRHKILQGVLARTLNFLDDLVQIYRQYSLDIFHSKDIPRVVQDISDKRFFFQDTQLKGDGYGFGLELFISRALVPVTLHGRYLILRSDSRPTSNHNFLRQVKKWSGNVCHQKNYFHHVGNGWCLRQDGQRLQQHPYWHDVDANADTGASFCEAQCMKVSSCIGYMVADLSKCALIHTANGTDAEPINLVDPETRVHCWAKYGQPVSKYRLEYVGNGFCTGTNGQRVAVPETWLAADINEDGYAARCAVVCLNLHSCIGYIVEDFDKCKVILSDGDNAGVHAADGETRNHCWAKVLSSAARSKKASYNMCHDNGASFRGEGAYDWVSLSGEHVRSIVLKWDFGQNPIGVITIASEDSDVKVRLASEGFVFLGKYFENIWIRPSYIIGELQKADHVPLARIGKGGAFEQFLRANMAMDRIWILEHTGIALPSVP